MAESYRDAESTAQPQLDRGPHRTDGSALDAHGHAHQGAAGATADGQDAGGGLAIQSPTGGRGGIRSEPRDKLGTAAGGIVYGVRWMSRHSDADDATDGQEWAHRPESSHASLEGGAPRREEIAAGFDCRRATRQSASRPLP